MKTIKRYSRNLYSPFKRIKHFYEKILTDKFFKENFGISKIEFLVRLFYDVDRDSITREDVDNFIEEFQIVKSRNRDLYVKINFLLNFKEGSRTKRVRENVNYILKNIKMAKTNIAEGIILGYIFFNYFRDFYYSFDKKKEEKK